MSIAHYNLEHLPPRGKGGEWGEVLSTSPPQAC